MDNLINKTPLEVVELAPFTMEDAKDEKACTLCKHKPSCPIYEYVNHLSLKRDGTTVDDKFSCSIYAELD